jgi:glutamate formiminotransferase/formiminotetrahydrofolate cyclodeaminase
VVVTGSEVVGMIPYEALIACGEFYLGRMGLTRGVPARDVLATAVQSLGLADLGPFEPEKQVLGLPPEPGALVRRDVAAFADEVSRPSPAPGGGSIAALAGALGAALAAMVANLGHAKKGLEERRDELEQVARAAQGVKERLVAAVDEDAAAFHDVIAAMRMPKGTDAERAAREAAIQAGYAKATDVPLATAELCLEALRMCRLVAEKGNPASITDAGVGALMARAGVLGAIDNVRINLPSITDAAWVAERTARLASLRDEADALEREVRALVDAAL